MIFDMHSHILPGVDDGAKDLAESLALLQMMKEQGITAVMATPHFYPAEVSADQYRERVVTAYRQLKEAIAGKDLPHILLGSEVLYYRYIGQSETIRQFCLADSPYLLLELSDKSIHDGLFEDILLLQEQFGIIPIIAHIERYHHFRGYQKLLDFVKKNHIPAQINASGVMTRSEFRIIKRLLRNNLVQFIGTDSHSTDQRPPMMTQALQKLEKKFGRDCPQRLLQNGRILYQNIVKDRSDAE